MKEILASLEEWNSTFGCYRPNGSIKEFDLKENLPLMWGDWNVYKENGEKFEDLNEIVISHRLDQYIKYVSIDDIEDSNHLYIITVYNPSFFRLNKDIGFSCISDKYKDDIREGRAKIVMLYLMEGYSGSKGNTDLEIIEEWRIKENFPSNSVYFINGNLISDKIAKDKNLDINVVGISNFDSNNRDFLDHYIPEFSPGEEKYLFLSYNRAPREHRIFMMAKMIEKGVFSSGLISLNKFNEHLYRYFINKNTKYKSVIDYLYNNTPFLINDKYDLVNNLACNIELDDYNSTFISLVTESLVENDTLFLSEKIWKPIIVGHPFIVFGNPNTLKYLKSLGYKTFDRWIDESYDSELDNNKRCDMIVNELVKLDELTKDQLKSMRKEMFDICEYNKELFKVKLNQNWNNDVNIRLLDYLNDIWEDSGFVSNVDENVGYKNGYVNNETDIVENYVREEIIEENEEIISKKMNENVKQRKYLPTLSELIDRLSICQLKEVFVPEHKEEYAQEIKDILHDIQICLDEAEEITADVVRAIVVLSQMNLHIWHNESNYRKGIKDGNNLELTHGLNGIRNEAKNRIQEIVGGRKDYKIDCLASEFKDWKISW